MALDTRNQAPEFGDQTMTHLETQNTAAARSIRENTKANSADDADITDNADDNVGEMLAATDSNTGDSLTYTLSGSDAGSFRVRNNNNNGQIEVGAGASLTTRRRTPITSL